MTLDTILFKLIKTLNRLKLPYMLTGGIAANYYGSIRSTLDIDVCIVLTEKDVQKFLKSLAEIGIKELHPEDVALVIKTGNRFFCYEPEGLYRIDFWLVKTPVEEQMLQRRKKTKINNVMVYFISIEDLIAYKFLHSRGRDIDDIKMILKVNKEKINFKLLKNIFAQSGLSYSKFKKLLDE